MTAPNHRAGRQQHLVRALLVSSRAVAALAAAALLVPDRFADDLGWAALVVLGLTPLVRVGWLGVRWARLGDRRFAATALALLCVVASGALLGA